MRPHPSEVAQPGGRTRRTDCLTLPVPLFLFEIHSRVSCRCRKQQNTLPSTEWILIIIGAEIIIQLWLQQNLETLLIQTLTQSRWALPVVFVELLTYKTKLQHLIQHKKLVPTSHLTCLSRNRTTNVWNIFLKQCSERKSILIRPKDDRPVPPGSVDSPEWWGVRTRF